MAGRVIDNRSGIIHTLALPSLLAPDHKEEQEAELEALNSIYTEEEFKGIVASHPNTGRL